MGEGLYSLDGLVRECRQLIRRLVVLVTDDGQIASDLSIDRFKQRFDVGRAATARRPL